VSDPGITRIIGDNLAAVRARIERAAARSGRSAADIRLVAVSKTHPAALVRAAFSAGQHEFGENRVQEALGKIAETADLPLRWHLIGHLQSNKARRAAAAPFACIQSLDSVDLLHRLNAAASSSGHPIEALVQADLAGETTKFGAAPAELDRIFAAAPESPLVSIRGLMLLPPFFDDAAQARPYFRRLRELRERLLARGVPGQMLRELSMGMSHDFDVAIEEGATIVRVGTAIFGRRT
jgi:pyridoxal phosphate enzyme (YggS family)